MATRLRDIAERVGVSTSTVSLVLSGRDRGRVSATSAAAIREAAEEMGYLPNLLAQGLKTRQSKTLGVLAEGVASIPFSGGMLAGAQDTAWESGYLLIVIDIGREDNMLLPGMRALLQRDVQACVIATDYHREIDVPAMTLKMPRVLLDARPGPGSDDCGGPIDWVVPDEEAGSYGAVHHLIEQGHRRIAWCGVVGDQYIAAGLRLRGYQRALADVGLTPHPRFVVEAQDPRTAAGFAAIRPLLSTADRPTAVFCFSDRLAMGVYQAAHDCGLATPGDLSVVGFDNQPDVADALRPGLTTVLLPHREMGAWAARAALRRLRDDARPTADHTLLGCPLVRRHSVAPPSHHAA